MWLLTTNSDGMFLEVRQRGFAKHVTHSARHKLTKKDRVALAAALLRGVA